MALFEFVVVDPGWVFLSWEITAEQREAARRAYGDEWYEARRLNVLFQNAGDSTTISRAALYGDAGRWFEHLNAPGALVVARLGFECRGARYELSTAGPLQIPRLRPIEPHRFTEMQVAYAVDISGRLSIAATRDRQSAESPVGKPGVGAPGGAWPRPGAPREGSSPGGAGGGER
jgi:Domain of unknown function (DUF4912)